MERQITFMSGDIRLEGSLHPAKTPNAAVIAHPHPQMGGSMHDAVVKLAADTYQQAQWNTLRFNFRGTGRSEGQYDQGNGEQHDLQAAVAALLYRGCGPIDLVGYSFGAWIIARWAQGNPTHGHSLVLIAPPVDILAFAPDPLPGLAHVIVGEHDGFAEIAHVKRYLGTWQPHASLHIIPAADHFFAGCGRALRSALADGIRNR